MATQHQRADVSRRRAILTDREREMIEIPAGERDDPQYVAISHVRRKINEELPEDLKILREMHPTLFEEFLDVVDEAREGDQ